MHFRIEQQFPAPLADVERAFTDPQLLARMSTLPKVGGAELLDQREDNGRLLQRIRYRFTGDLNSAVTAVVDPERLTWVEESSLDRLSHITTWRIVPDHYASRLSCSGTFKLTSKADDLTIRITEADIKVHFPLVGGKVERAIVSGLEEHAAGEEQVVADYLTGA